MARRETEHAAPSRFATGNQQIFFAQFAEWRFLLQRRKIVIKNKCLRVRGFSFQRLEYCPGKDSNWGRSLPWPARECLQLALAMVFALDVATPAPIPA
jgi:hypothetical protein